MCPNLKSPQKHQFPQLQTRLSFDQTLPQFITRWSLHQREGEGTRTGTLSLICVNLSCCLDTLAQDWTRYTTCLTTRSCSVQPNLPLLCHLGRLHLDCPSTPSPLFFDQVYFNVSMLYDIANCMLNYWPNTPLQRHRIILMEDVHNFRLKIWCYVILGWGGLSEPHWILPNGAFFRSFLSYKMTCRKFQSLENV